MLLGISVLTSNTLFNLWSKCPTAASLGEAQGNYIVRDLLPAT